MAETAAQGDNTASQPGKAKQLILLGAFVAHLIVLGGSLGVIYKMTLGWQPPVTREEELRQILKDREKLIEKGRHPQNDIIELVEKDLAVDALSVPFDEIVTNLNGLPSRMIKMQLYFKVLDEYTFQLIATPPRKVEIRDTILRIIQRKSYQDLETLQGKLLLKNEILTEVNRLLPDGVIRDVYFYEFVIQ
ncbi:MAG: flagellar basal body-associated FliL family protein [Bdellovibrionaceae bacterium]|jgi:flagellar FliL protein|nr:flagellar basal body-associated FliL family protein [Pseudobdellovibrionaceae bacterium]